MTEGVGVNGDVMSDLLRDLLNRKSEAWRA